MKQKVNNKTLVKKKNNFYRTYIIYYKNNYKQGYIAILYYIYMILFISDNLKL